MHTTSSSKSVQGPGFSLKKKRNKNHLRFQMLMAVSFVQSMLHVPIYTQEDFKGSQYNERKDKIIEIRKRDDLLSHPWLQHVPWGPVRDAS